MRCLFVIVVLLGVVGCDNEFVTSTELPQPETLLAEYGALPAGTFAFRRYESANDPGERHRGTVGYGPLDGNDHRHLCMRYADSLATVWGPGLAAPAPGLRTDEVVVSLLFHVEDSREDILLVTDTSGGRIAGVFAARMRRVGQGGSYSSLVEGGFNAVFDGSTECSS